MCEYCNDIENGNEALVETPGFPDDGLWAGICDKSNVLQVRGWYDDIVGICPQEVAINFCPMCGRDLKEGE